MGIFDFFKSVSKRCLQIEDQELIEMIKKGGRTGERAINCMFEKYFDLARIMLNKKAYLSQEEVLDAYTEAILATHEAIYDGRFRKEAKIRTFLQAIFSNKCVDVIRKKKTNKKKEEKDRTVNIDDYSFIDLPSIELNEEEKIILDEIEKEQILLTKEKVQQLMIAMEKLSKKCRALLKDILETREAIVQIHGFKTKGVARERISNCRKKLIAILEEMGLDLKDFQI